MDKVPFPFYAYSSGPGRDRMMNLPLPECDWEHHDITPFHTGIESFTERAPGARGPHPTTPSSPASTTSFLPWGERTGQSVSALYVPHCTSCTLRAKKTIMRANMPNREGKAHSWWDRSRVNTSTFNSCINHNSLWRLVLVVYPFPHRR